MGRSVDDWTTVWNANFYRLSEDEVRYFMAQIKKQLPELTLDQIITGTETFARIYKDDRKTNFKLRHLIDNLESLYMARDRNHPNPRGRSCGPDCYDGWTYRKTDPDHLRGMIECTCARGREHYDKAEVEVYGRGNG